MARARNNGLFDFLTKQKTTYSAAKARQQRDRERARDSKASLAVLRRADAARRKAAKQEERRRDRQEAGELRKLEVAERKRKAERRKADEVDRKIEREMREKGYRNPDCARTVKEDVSDRAKRYRANQDGCLPDGPRVCALCGSRSQIMVDHKDGDESNGARRNLRYLCRSCNTKVGADMARKGKGRRTVQYNAGAETSGEYLAAVLDHTRGAHDAGGKIIHDTPKSRRREFAGEFWDSRKARGNPVDAAAELSEAWHGRPAETETDYVDKIHVHEVLTDLGRLKEIKVMVSARKAQAIRFDAETRLASNESGQQLYIVGGDQSLDLGALGIGDDESDKDLVVVGSVHSITYVTAKHHLGKQDRISGPYEHQMGEDSGVMPVLVYDTMNQECGFAGGSYKIDPTDYDGSHSAGIRN